MRKLIDKLVPLDELQVTMRRFPLSVLCALSLFVIGLLSVHDVLDNEELVGRVAAILACCYFWFGIAKLINESRAFKAVKAASVHLIGALGITAIITFSSLWGIHLAFIIPALLLLIMVAPYLRGGDDLSVWFFNRMMWFGVVVSYVALFMFAGGLSAALAAVKTLFGVKVHGDVFADIWLFASLVLGPLYALSWVPKSFTFTQDDCSDPPGLKFLVNWISVPMVFVYLLILYAYFIKIVVTGEVPNGHLAYMISGFVGAGIVTYLAAHPLREEGSPQLKLFYKVFFPALLVPVAFHVYAISERVLAYGITEQRYALMLSAVWFGVIALGNTFWKMPIRFIPMTLAALLLVASFGPWGAVSVSGQSQFNRLEHLLIKNALLQNDEIKEAEDAVSISFEDRVSISSILDYLCRSERDDLIAPWFNTENKENWSCNGAYNLTKKFGFEYVSSFDWNWGRDREKQINFYSQNDVYVDLRGYDFLVKNVSARLISDNNQPYKSSMNSDITGTIYIEYDGDYLSLGFDGVAGVNVNMDTLTQYFLQPGKKPDLVHKHEDDNGVYKLVFKYMHGGYVGEDQVEIRSMNFDFYYRIKGE